MVTLLLYHIVHKIINQQNLSCGYNYMPLHAAEFLVKLTTPEIDLRDVASLQREARIYFNYCVSCHSMQYAR